MKTTRLLRVLSFLALFLAVSCKPIEPTDFREPNGSTRRPRYYAVTINDSHPSVGPKTAALTVVSWNDFQETSGFENAKRLESLRKMYPQDIRLVVRFNPSVPHLRGRQTALALYAAGQHKKFWRFYNALLQREKITENDLIDIALSLGLSLPLFRDQILGTQATTMLAVDRQDALKLGLPQPAFHFFNGRPVPVDTALAEMKRIAEEEIQRGKSFKKNAPEGADIYPLILLGAMQVMPASVSEIKPPNDPLPTFSLSPADIIIGDADAPSQVVLFFDGQCPFSISALRVLLAIQNKHPARFRIVVKHLPMPWHDMAMTTAGALCEANAQGKSIPFLNVLLGNREPLSVDSLLAMGKSAGIDAAKLAHAMESRVHTEQISADITLAESLGIIDTPGIFINEAIIRGALTEPRLLDLLDTTQNDSSN